MSDGGCQCAGAVAQLQREVSALQGSVQEIYQEMAEIAQAIVGMTKTLSGDLRDVNASVKLSNVELAAIAGTAAATAVSVEKNFRRSHQLQQRQTSAMVQLDSIKTFTEALALKTKVVQFGLEVDERYEKAVQGMFLNRILYNKHFNAIRDDFDSKIQSIGSHIFRIRDEDIAPVAEAAKIPMEAQQGLALEVDLQRLAARSSLLDNDLDMIRKRHLEPKVTMDADFERSLSTRYAIDGGRPAVTRLEVHAVVSLTDSSVATYVSCAVGANGELSQRNRLPDHVRFCESDAGNQAIRRAATMRPMTDEEYGQLTEAIESLASRGLIDSAIVPGYMKYLESKRLNILDDSAKNGGAANA